MTYNSSIKIYVVLYNVFLWLPSVIDYYKNNGIPVHMYMLDASKAFDRVNLLTLFKTLYSRGMFPIYLRLLMKIYEEQQMRIRWNNAVSAYFTISNGVTQGGGGVISCTVQYILGPAHSRAQTSRYGLLYEWFIYWSIYIC